MNTKKIMALTLAALMAAGTTTAAFAEATKKDQALVFTTAAAYEENDDGLLVLDDGVVNPGDSLYFLLKDGADDGNGITDKERDRINVYADWKLGKEYIEDIDVIYKKGNSAVTGYTYTVTASEGYYKTNPVVTLKDATKYTDSSLATFKGKLDLTKALAADYTKLTANEGYKANSGNKYYSDDVEGLKALLDDLSDWEVATGTVDAIADTDNGTGNGLASYTSQTTGESVEGYYINTSKKLLIKPELVGSITNLFALDDSDTEFAAVSGGAYTFTDSNYTAVVDGDYLVNTGLTDAGTVKSKTDAETAIKATITAIDSSKTVANRDSSSYTYWVEVKTKDDITTKELDLAGTLYLGTTKNSAEKNGTRLPVDMSLTNRLYDSSKNFLSVEDEVTIDPDANGAVKFDPDAEEVTIYFGENEDAWFTFNAQGQSALNLAYTTKFNKEIADLFPKANIDFITWTAAPATNRTGDLYITADEDTFLYEVTKDGIKEVNGAEYDEDEGAWHIRTRKLASYVISDMELDTSVKLDNDSSSSTSSGSNTNADGDKPNPDTGR